MTMPWHNRDYLHLSFLICCLPLQYYLSQNTPAKVDINGITNYISFLSITELSMTFSKWWSFLNDCSNWLVTNIFEVLEGVDESPAIEVFEYRKKHGMQEKKTRRIHSTRPEGLWFRVGQVVEHLHEGYKGVIIDWEFDPKESNSPLYRILVDEKTADEEEIEFISIIEVEQDMLYLLKGYQIANRFLKNYFTAFDGSQYIPQPWLHELYPKD